MRPATLAFFLLFGAQAGSGDARGLAPQGTDAAGAASVEAYVELGADAVANGDSACSCPRFMCGKVPYQSCQISCQAPAVAKCVCRTCTDYDRDNQCACASP